jgi:uncharacterized protein (TIGR00266 family)
MSAKTYNLSITGAISDYASEENALSAFAALFKMDATRVERLFSQAPMVIKKNIDADTLKKYQAALDRVGVEYAVEDLSAAAVVESDDYLEIVSSNRSDSSISEAEAPISAAEAPIRTERESAIQLQTQREEQPAPPADDLRGFAYTIEGQPDYSFVTVQIPANETIRVEASAMATMDTNMVMKTKAKGGLSRFVSGESLFINEFTAEHGPGEIGIAAGAPGDLKHQYLDDETIYLQNSAFVASSMGVLTETKWQGLTKGFFSGESLFLIRCSGSGDLWFNTYGAIIEIDIEEDYVVDTGNIVAFTEGLEYNITKVGGYKSLFFSGEGFVCRFSGKGKVWIQTRSVGAFTSWAHWYRPVKKKG